MTCCVFGVVLLSLQGVNDMLCCFVFDVVSRSFVDVTTCIYMFVPHACVNIVIARVVHLTYINDQCNVYMTCCAFGVVLLSLQRGCARQVLHSVWSRVILSLPMPQYNNNVDSTVDNGPRF